MRWLMLLFLVGCANADLGIVEGPPAMSQITLVQVHDPSRVCSHMMGDGFYHGCIERQGSKYVIIWSNPCSLEHELAHYRGLEHEQMDPRIRTCDE